MSEDIEKSNRDPAVGEPFDINKPFSGAHSCVINPRSMFQQAHGYRSMTRSHKGKDYRILIGRLKNTGKSREHSYRYDKDVWSADEARVHCKAHEGRFEPAKSVKKYDDFIRKWVNPEWKEE